MRAQPEYLKRMIERSKLYLYYIVEEVEKRGMPTRSRCCHGRERVQSHGVFALARLRPVAIHSFDGKTYKLSQNWWADSRRDVVASTNAALDYLSLVRAARRLASGARLL